MVIAETKGYHVEEIISTIIIGRKYIRKIDLAGIDVNDEFETVVVDATTVTVVVG